MWPNASIFPRSLKLPSQFLLGSLIQKAEYTALDCRGVFMSTSPRVREDGGDNDTIHM